jgi:hypothetical protein
VVSSATVMALMTVQINVTGEIQESGLLRVRETLWEARSRAAGQRHRIDSVRNGARAGLQCDRSGAGRAASSLDHPRPTHAA